MDFTSSVLIFTPSLCVCKRNMHVRRLSGQIKQEWGTEEADRGTMANQLACNMEKPCDLGQEDRNKDKRTGTRLTGGEMTSGPIAEGVVNRAKTNQIFILLHFDSNLTG